jgi:hypothetical protein
LWQISAALNGSEAVIAVAQHAPIGARICTNKAMKKIGKYFRSRARILVVPERGPINHAVNDKSSAMMKVGRNQARPASESNRRATIVAA